MRESKIRHHSPWSGSDWYQVTTENNKKYRDDTAVRFYDLFHIPISQAPLIIANPQAIPKLSHITLSLLPPTSFHPTCTSCIGILAASVSMSISTSKIHLSECMYGMMYGKAGRVNNLNPHCVSPIREVTGVVSRRMNTWNAYMSAFRSIDR
jgi:hypothetical protein